jgi:FKBP12-rapamycin complex-associated protein
MVEFMDRKKVPLEINTSLLAECAKASTAYPKSLYYKELEFEDNPEQSMEDLIQIYMLLGQPENATGLLKIARSMGIECKVEWYEKLGYYEEAYKLYLAREKLASPAEKQTI